MRDAPILTVLRVIALAILSCATARADVQVPGTIRAQHTLRFVDVAEHPGWSFFVHAPDTSIVLDVPASGEVGLESIGVLDVPDGLHLYAVPSGTPVPADRFGKIAVLRGGAGVLRSNRLVDPIRAVGSSEDPRVVTEYSVAIGDALVVRQVGGAEPRVLPRKYWLPGGAAVAILVAIGIRRRRRRRAARAESASR